MSNSSSWYLYLLECENDYLYAGISTDVMRRFRSHCEGKGAKFTRINRPQRVLGVAAYPDRGQATSAEIELKRMSRQKKLQWAAIHSAE